METTNHQSVAAPAVRMGAFLSGWVDPDEKPSRYIDRLLDRVPAVREAGFSSVWVGQHLLGHPWPVLDTSVYLGRMSALIGDMDMGGVYLLPLAHPVRLAESLVSLDNISGGRFIAAPALGWRPAEFEAIGVPVTERAARFGEVLQIMRKLWYSQEPVSFEGRFYSIKDVQMTARPEREGGIPIWIGASSVPAVKRAARFGDTWLGSSHTPFVTLQELAAAYADELQVVGKTPVRRPLLRHCMVAETDKLAEERFTEAFTAYYNALGTWGIFKEVVGEQHTSGDGELPPGRAIVGSPETCLKQLSRYTELGFNEFIFQVGLPGTPEPYVRESMQLLGKEVMPRLEASFATAAV
ncbi:LLM class flavin-dependent oxidoreductase [Hydrogenophaga sp.]|uniref:LLM class flavin-dependent oxidoreductase n=1 Tax=Hydrogenophaga sp. TaxID=1904254 RepID=UPI0027233AA1|nr:LLM class flavin-dependent oxidoreductase [Hydrogenophaga sp.]MDO9433949.1 LLM class flavin-dependent oxidoreductase [Hydrogenophaga sp.]